jgi:hypothetical protein
VSTAAAAAAAAADLQYTSCARKPLLCMYALKGSLLLSYPAHQSGCVLYPLSPCVGWYSLQPCAYTWQPALPWYMLRKSKHGGSAQPRALQ